MISSWECVQASALLMSSRSPSLRDIGIVFISARKYPQTLNAMLLATQDSFGILGRLSTTANFKEVARTDTVLKLTWRILQISAFGGVLSKTERKRDTSNSHPRRWNITALLSTATSKVKACLM